MDDGFFCILLRVFSKLKIVGWEELLSVKVKVWFEDDILCLINLFIILKIDFV